MVLKNSLDWKDIKPVLKERRRKGSEVIQSCPTLCYFMDCSLPGSFIRGVFQARIQEWVAISFFRGIFLTQGLNPDLSHCKQTLIFEAIREALLKEINPEYSLEALMLKLQYFGHLMRRAISLKKTLILGKMEGKRRGRRE